MGLGIEIIKYVIISFAIVGFKVAKNRLFFVPVLFAALLYAAFNDNDLLALNHSAVHPISYEVVSRYTAVQASAYTALMLLLLTFFVAMLLFFCNTVFRRQHIGMITAAAFVIFDWTCYLTGSSHLLWLSPVSWINISRMAYARDTNIPDIPYGIITIVLIDVILVAAAGFLSGKRDINILTEEI